MHYIYLIKRGEKTTYIGVTGDLKRRLKEHKRGESDLVYYEAYKDRRDALDREKKLKQRGQTVRRLKEKLKHSLS